MIRDPLIISQISLKQLDHYIFMDEKNDPLFFYGLFQLKGNSMWFVLIKIID